MRSADGELSLGHALALGLLQGPAELLPVSSSAHTALLPWLAGWPGAGLDGEAHKSLQIVLHAGTTAALSLAMGRELRLGLGALGARRAAGLLTLSCAPAAIAGLTLRGAIERRLGGPRATAVGLLAGAVAMGVADLASEQRGRGCGEADARDGLALGLAQAAALVPGISRSGAALTVARARGFDRAGAHRLSWGVALPVLTGVSALESLRLLKGRAGIPLASAASGGAAAFLSTLASVRVLGRPRGSLLPYALYRCGLAAAVLLRLRRAQ
jgi:undecaprenyl-diphosphatase